MKTCTRCKKQKPMDEFYARAKLPDGRISQCKECYRQRVNARMQAIRDKTYVPNKSRSREPAIKKEKKLQKSKMLGIYASIVEEFVCGGPYTQKQLAEKFGVGTWVVTNALNRYFKKPDKNLTLKSKV